MWRLMVLLAVAAGILALGFSLVDAGKRGDVSAQAVIQTGTVDINSYARAVEPWDWQFPRDHGAHPAFQTEWWYYTGNLQADNGRRFGFQFTVFRRAINPLISDSPSEWRTGQIYMAHFTVSDIANERFFHDERYSRGGAGLAGAMPVYGDESTYDEAYHVWLEDWQVRAVMDGQYLINAQSGSFAVDLTLNEAKPPALQGYAGLSPKSAEVGNASYYYSLPRLETAGTVRIDDQSFAVTGVTWMDHEFSTSALGGNAQGWDWFGLIFDEGYELMVGKIRLVDGGREPAFGGLLILPNGETRYLPSETFTIEPTTTWTSPHTGAVYPAGWIIRIDAVVAGRDEDVVLTVTPLQADQELHSGDIAYWEGAVRVEGTFHGYGYAELTGYVDSMTGRF